MLHQDSDVAGPAMNHHPATVGHGAPDPDANVQISGRWFVLACAAAALVMLVLGRFVHVPRALVAVELFATILALFVLGSFRYRLDKNALTYGMAMVIFATFMGAWWSGHHQRGAPTGEEVRAWGAVLQHYTLTFHGLDELVHLDTMLFILGLTLFVAVIAQTRVLEAVTLSLLRRNKGHVLPTVVAVTAVVAMASGVFDGVSMIGLTIRTLVIIMVLARAPTSSIRYAVMVCTAVTTVCGMWLAYGEPPNLIMKANLVDASTGRSLLTDGFFLRYCLPAAALCYLCVAWSLRGKLRGQRVNIESMDMLDAQAETVRFLQASRHGEVLTAAEFVAGHGGVLGAHRSAVQAWVMRGEPLGQALVAEGVAPATRRELLGAFVAEDLAAGLDEHYAAMAQGDHPAADQAVKRVEQEIRRQRHRRVLAQGVGVLAMAPFVGLLVLHALYHHVPLFLASFAGFAVALAGIWTLPRMRRLALREARHEYAEYYFLFPLFLSISLLANLEFFDSLRTFIASGVKSGHTLPLALGQFGGAALLSAILDNNVVADFASHALHGLGLAVLHLFAMSQIAGYAVGGCWTHIGCAQSVVAYAYIQREVDRRYTPLQWIKEITPLLLAMMAVVAALIALESLLIGALG